MPTPTLHSGVAIDFSPRVFPTATVAASPSAATETIIATVTCSGDYLVNSGVLLFGYAAFTVGTNGDAATLRIRRTDASGTVVKSSGATNAGVLAATQLTDMSMNAFDANLTVPQVYVLTLTVANANAASTVSAVTLVAIPI